MSNFDFLRDFDNVLWKIGNRVEAQVRISPSAVTAEATRFLEHVLKQLLLRCGMTYSSSKDFYSQIDAVYRSGLISYRFKNTIYSAYSLRNKIHADIEETEKNEFIIALAIHEKLYNIAKKYYRDFNENYDEYKGVPHYKPIELDTSDDEIELVKIPDFSQITDIQYDYCIICGQPNHSSYSLCCAECGRILDNANNYISIRNYFGKDATFTKEELIEFGIPEGYANQLITHLTREDMLKVRGRNISFNNMYFDRYMEKIDNYLAVGELITKFHEDEIIPSEIKQTREYKMGSKKQDPFYQFFKIINHEIISKFERDILATHDIKKSIEYTTITQKQLKRWYDIQLANHNRGKYSESFDVFNKVLRKNYIELKKQGILDSEIKARLNISPEIYEFWIGESEEFLEEITQIKKDLIIKSLNENRTRKEAIEIAGVSPKEYENIVKLSDFKNNEFSKRRNEQINARKENFIEFLKSNDVETACRLAKITKDDFYEWYEKNMSSQFYIDATGILMHNFLNQRRTGKSKLEAADAIKLDYVHVERWFKRTLKICEEFKNNHTGVVVNLCYQGFKNNQSKKQIAKHADISVNRLNSYLELGRKGYGTYKKLYDYYQSHIIPKQLSRFLDEIKNKTFKKALELSELSEEEFNYYYNLGENGDKNFTRFYHDYLNIKLDSYIASIKKGKSESKALRNANLDKNTVEKCYILGKNANTHFTGFYEKIYEHKLDIYISRIIKGDGKYEALKKAGLSEDELEDDIDEVILSNRMLIVNNALCKDLTTKQAASKANVDIETVFDWFLKGRSGEELYKKFADNYYEGYIMPGSRAVQRAVNMEIPVNDFIKINKKHFTVEDYEFWQENGFLKEAQQRIDAEEEDD